VRLNATPAGEGRFCRHCPMDGAANVQHLCTK
jgi:hypothetical protein